jgi:putative ABC transport system permease protein
LSFTEAIRVAFASLRANKLRSFLTVLGILIGVSSVVAVVAIINGLDGYVSDKVMRLGTKGFSLQRMPDVITSRELFLEMQKRKDITLADLEAVRKACEACSEVGAMVATSRTAKLGRLKQPNVRVMGITENYSRIGTILDLQQGRQLVQEDMDHARTVAVIGADVAEALFGLQDPIGRSFSVENHELTVVGVAEKKGSIFGNSQDNFAWIPISTFRKLYGARRSILIQAEAKTIDRLEAAEDQCRVIMRARRHLAYGKPDDFNIETGESVMSLWQSFTGGIYVVTLVVTVISLIVGGIVVMNIMLVSVTERIREIGVRKALGARRRDILRQFLVESVILAVFGGLLGVLGAAVFSMLLAAVLGGIMSADFSAPVRLWAVCAALGVSTVVGLVAGIYPASRAAALDPVVALRSE